MIKKQRAASASIRTVAGTPRRSAANGPRSTRLVWLAAILGGALVVAVVALLFIGFDGGPSAREYSCDELLGSPADASAADGFATRSLGDGHVAPGTRISYGFCPPTSGQHYSAAGRGPLRPGFYDADDAAGPGGWVHNLEHGYVVALYRCPDGACPSADDLASLRTFVASGPPTQSAAACGYRSKVLAARFDEMSTPFALLAWDRALLLDGFDVTVALDFASRWIEATGPEPNAC